MKIRISDAIANDYGVRAIDEAPYNRIDGPGVYEIGDSELAELLDDCKHQGNIGGNYIDPVSTGLTRAYRALHKQATGSSST